MFFYPKDFSHTMVLAKKEHIYFGSHDNFYCLVFAMYLGTTLMYAVVRPGPCLVYLTTSKAQKKQLNNLPVIY